MSRSYQELSNAMLGYNQSLKIQLVPFPFVCAQARPSKKRQEAQGGTRLYRLSNGFLRCFIEWLEFELTGLERDDLNIWKTNAKHMENG